MTNNNIPKHWQLKKLGEVCNVLDNLRKPINSSERQQRISGKSQGELYPYYGATGQVGWIDDFLTEGDYILIGEDGAPFLDIYKDKAYKIKGKTWVNNHAHILKGKEQFLLDDFALHYLNSINYREFVNGTTRLKLTKSSLVEIPFVVPSLTEQQAIVAKIEELLSELENGKQQLFTAQQQLKVYRQSLLKWAFEGKLINKNVKEGELPKGWKWVKLGSIATKITDGEHITPRRTSSGFLLLSARNIQNGFFALDNVDYVPEDEYTRIIKRCNPEPGDILISCSGTIGRVCRVPKDLKFVMVRSVALVKLDWSTNSSKFYEYLFQSPILQRHIEKSKKATAQANLFLGPIKNLDVIVCSLEEQEQIVSELESKLTVCDKIEETISQSLQQAETLKQSILKQAFEGKLITAEKLTVVNELP